MAMEEEECDGCDSADPQRRLDDSLLRLADVHLIAATTVESGDRDDVDACDRHRHVFHWAGG